MAAPEFYSGDMSAITITIGANTYQLPARSWNLTINGNNKNVSNFRDGRYRIGGLVDASGSIEMPLDGALYLPKAKDIMTSVKLYTNYYAASTYFFGLAAIIDSISPSINLESEFALSIAFSLQSGTVTYPVYP